jgi:hypothetical protein
LVFALVHGTVVVGDAVDVAPAAPSVVDDAPGVPFPALSLPAFAPEPDADRPAGHAHGVFGEVPPGVPPPPAWPVFAVPPAPGAVVEPCDAPKLLSEHDAATSRAQSSATTDPRPTTTTTVDGRRPPLACRRPIVQPRFSEAS